MNTSLLRIFACALSIAHLPSIAQAAESPTQLHADLLIVGGTESGWAAAIQAARLGIDNIVIVHDGKWLGGQYTEQSLVCVDENKGPDNVGWGVDWHPMKRSFHRSGLFKELMDRIEAFNTQKYGSPMPGRPWHGPSTFRPAEAEAIFREMLQPYIDSGQVTFIPNYYPFRADVAEQNGRPVLKGLHFKSLVDTTGDIHITSKLTIDASDWGEVLQVSGAAYEAGPDPPSRYGEPSAPVGAPINEMNPITWAMIVAESNGDTPIPRPPNFDDRNYPRATPFSQKEFRSLHWDISDPGQGSILHWPDAGKASSRQLSVFSVRRVVDGYTSKDGKTSILLNYMNGQDYPLERLPQRLIDKLEATEPGASTKNIALMTREQRQIVFDDAKNHSLGVLYHLQNFVHDRAPDKTNSFRHFHLSPEFGTPDHLPPKPYIRESLRLKAMYMMREQDGRNRDGVTKDRAKPRFAAVMYPDGLFAWQFHYDFHRTGRTYLVSEGNDGPWIDYHKPNRHTKFISDRSLFPLRSLIPEQMDGLIGAQGNVGFSSIVSAAIRLHDQRVHIGQAAGATAAVALSTGKAPREFPYNRDLLEQVRSSLCGNIDGAVPLLIWPFRDLPAGHASFVAINRLAALGVLPLESRDVDFRPDDPVDPAWLDKVKQNARLETLEFRALPSSRSDACDKVWAVLKQDLSAFALTRASSSDADADGIPDIDDALLFTPNEPIEFRIESEPLTPETDGIPTLPETSGIKSFDFCGDGKAGKGFIADRGAQFDFQRGFGWGRDLTRNHRRRNSLSGPRDTFVFTRETDSWECELPNGRYRTTVCVGDSGHEQLQQTVVVEGVVAIDHHTTASGAFQEAQVVAEVKDGRLTLVLGSGESGSNTCINWLLIEPVNSD